MKRLKKLFLYAILLVVCLGIAGFLVVSRVSESGSGLVENWIGSQLQAVANGYLNPQLSFSSLDYRYPGTVSLTNLKLTADDPANPGHKIDIIGCGKVVLTLAEVPARGKPILIEKIVLDQPLFSAVAVAPLSKELVGFSRFIRTKDSAATNPENAVPAQTSSAPAPAATAPAPATAAPAQVAAAPATSPAPSNRPKLSDVFRIRLIQVNDGRVVYDPRIPGTVPMELDKITTTLNVTPTEAGWYKVNTQLSRKPIFDLDLAGQLNLDTLTARDTAMKLTADLSQDKLDYLPPQLQRFLKRYEVTGSLNSTVIADNIQFTHPLKGDLSGDLKLSRANVTLGEFHIPVDDLDLAVRMHDGKANLNKLSIAALKGTADITGSATLSGNIDSDLRIQIAGMLLQELLAERSQGKPMKLAGKVNANAQITAPLKVVIVKAKNPSTQPGAVPSPLLAEPLPDSWGSATISITDARLIRLPVVYSLTSAIAAASKIVTGDLFGGTTDPKETLQITSTFSRDQINVADYHYVGDAVAARGSGTVTLDRQLDLKVYGGPVKIVEVLLGKQIGGMIGVVTDQLVSYRVTGTSANPHVSVEAGGGGSVVDTTKRAATGIGEGVGKVGESIGKGLDNIFKKDDPK